MGDVPDDAEIVRDEQVGEPHLALQVGEEVEHLRLDRDVEGRDRLVGDDQLRLEHQRAGDGDALALAAGEHVRVAAVVLRPQADLRHHVARPRGALGTAELGVDGERLFQDRADLLARIEGAVGVLEDELHRAAQPRRLARRRVRRRRCRRA